MTDFNDWYNENTILKGDECSRILAQKTAPTLQNHPDVVFVKSGMNHIAVISPRKNHNYFAFSYGGPSDETDMKTYVDLLVQKGIIIAKDMGLIPIGFADVIDASRSDPALAAMIGDVLAEESMTYKKRFGHSLAILNGEYADLGERVNADANMNLTMICCSKEKFLGVPITASRDTIFNPRDNIKGMIFNPDGNFIYLNSDGVGTKHILYELAGLDVLAVKDSAAMKLDDLVKINATAIMLSDVLEHNGFFNKLQEIQFSSYASQIFSTNVSSRYGCGLINVHNVGDRLRPYKDGMVACNLSGSAVSLISEKNLNNLPVPREGDYLLSIRNAKIPNNDVLEQDGPRSNGISLLRRIPRDKFGEEWYKTDEGKEILNFATTPSDIFYPVFRDLLNKGLASSVFHLSGGAYNGKLARPLAKERIHVTLENLWPVSDIVKRLIEISGMPPASFYNKWVMSNPGFISTGSPAEARQRLDKLGYSSTVVGRLEKSDNPGVSMAAYDGTPLYFDGK